MDEQVARSARAEGRKRLRLGIRGAVQGVGFRPFVYRQAHALGVSGWVANSAEGVTIEAEAEEETLAALLVGLRRDAPASAVVTALESREVAVRGDAGFTIRQSAATGARAAQILPDQATCADCLAELLDPADRRYLYPFVNCTLCGPRYSIVEDVPYDRPRTTMRHFEMCPACRAEYENPFDRRFHAEAIACPACGPRLALLDVDGRPLGADHGAVLDAARAIRSGRIVAVKGIGGFHLMVDARYGDAVRRLRTRKRREAKPFAVMFPTLAALRRQCRMSPAEETLLCGPERPIVLLARTGTAIAAAVAPDTPSIGAMLPYSPLHHLLMRELGFPVVATSGNLADEPIATDNAEALERLAGIADIFLVHDRPIARPIDDSVARVVCGRELLLRRSRGYAPSPIPVRNLRGVDLALGAHLKAAVAVTAPQGVVLSEHLGDQVSVAARETHRRARSDIARLHATPARRVVRDLHPDYATTREAEALGLPVIGVQHHLAHVAACVAEHGAALPVLGVAWDGSGYGPDGTVWGGEFLHVAATGWRRVAHLRTFRLPGGETAVREPRRAALGLLCEAFGAEAWVMTDLAPVAAFTPGERKVVDRMVAQGVNAPLTSSAGRLFDAFAALAGLRQRADYEGQAAAQLEWEAGGLATGRAYPFAVRRPARGEAPLIIDWQPALEAALADIRAHERPAVISEALHNGLAAAIVETAKCAGERRVALTGGCFQNARLTEAAVTALGAAGFEPIWHRRIPPNDGGIALGQAVWAAWTAPEEDAACV